MVEPVAPPPVQAIRGRTEMGAPDAGFNFGTEGQGAVPVLPERILSPVVTRALGDLEPLRAIQPALLERRGVELVSMEASELPSIRFAITSRGEAASLEDLQRTLRSTAFSNQLDRMRDDIQQELELDKSVTISVAGVSFGLSVVYVLWLIRGGVLMGSYLSALPAWRVLDPLPVLSRVDEEAEEDDEALDGVDEKGGNALRGFG